MFRGAHAGSFTRTRAQTRELPIPPRAEGKKGSDREGAKCSLGRSRGFSFRSRGRGLSRRGGWAPTPTPYRRCGRTGPPGPTACPDTAWSFPPVRDASCPGLGSSVNLAVDWEAARRGVFYVEKESVGSSWIYRLLRPFSALTCYEEGTGPRSHKRSWWEPRKKVLGPSHSSSCFKCPRVYLRCSLP